jgi:hypothetical protein
VALWSAPISLQAIQSENTDDEQRIEKRPRPLAWRAHLNGPKSLATPKYRQIINQLWTYRIEIVAANVTINTAGKVSATLLDTKLSRESVPRKDPALDAELLAKIEALALKSIQSYDFSEFRKTNFLLTSSLKQASPGSLVFPLEAHVELDTSANDASPNSAFASLKVTKIVPLMARGATGARTKYPPAMQRRGIEAKIWVRVPIVNGQAALEQLSIARRESTSSFAGTAFDESALDAVRTMRITDIMTVNGKPITELAVPIVFQMTP